METCRSITGTVECLNYDLPIVFLSLPTYHQDCSGTAGVAVHFPRDISIPHGLMTPSSTVFKLILSLFVLYK